MYNVMWESMLRGLADLDRNNRLEHQEFRNITYIAAPYDAMRICQHKCIKVVIVFNPCQTGTPDCIVHGPHILRG